MALPARDLNQELEKTRGLAHGLTMALQGFVYHSGLVTETDDYRALSIIAFGDVLADRLDDLCNMNAEEAAAMQRRLKTVGGSAG